MQCLRPWNLSIIRPWYFETGSGFRNQSTSDSDSLAPAVILREAYIEKLHEQRLAYLAAKRSDILAKRGLGNNLKP